MATNLCNQGVQAGHGIPIVVHPFQKENGSILDVTA